MAPESKPAALPATPPTGGEHAPSALERAALAARGPILAPPGSPAAAASRPDSGLEDEAPHRYESNPAPWWIGVLWAAFFAFGVAYLIVNLLR
ncbi:MAG TPA: hypothetical protein VFD92_16600 [Candidatus Binatia bacterium]|nr:hypothetical protein [Candidatus Binatia bacterium]